MGGNHQRWKGEVTVLSFQCKTSPLGLTLLEEVLMMALIQPDRSEIGDTAGVVILRLLPKLQSLMVSKACSNRSLRNHSVDTTQPGTEAQRALWRG